MAEEKYKIRIEATSWTIAVFFFATLADACFHTHFYTLGVAGVAFTIASAVFSITLIGRMLGM